MSRKEYFVRSLEASIVKVTKGEAAYELFLRGALPDSLVAQDASIIRTLANNYTGPDGAAHARKISAAEAAAYCLYYLPINAYKAFTVLEAIGHHLSHSSDRFRVLDFGCGPGSASLALCESYPEQLQIQAIDHSDSMLSLAQRIVAEYCKSRHGVSFEVASRMRDIYDHKFDLIFASNVLCEMDKLVAQKTLDRFYQHLDQQGIIVMIEPALVAPTRRLMHLRDILLHKFSDIVPVFPCTRCDNCPMRAQSDTDWCHGTLGWEKSQLVSQIDRLTGFNKHRLKYSALVVGRNAKMEAGYRVIQPAAKTRQGVQALLCGAGFYGWASLPKKERSPCNRPIEKAKSFDRLLIEKWQEPPTISKTTQVTAS